MGCGSSTPTPLATTEPLPAPGLKTPTGANGAAAKPSEQKKNAAGTGSVKDGTFAAPPETRATGSMARPKTSIVHKLLPDDEVIARLEGLKTMHPENLAAKHFSKKYWESLGRSEQTLLLKCVRVGTYHPTIAGPGCYAMKPEDYDKLRQFFAPLVADVQGVPEKTPQTHDWALPDPLSFSDIGLAPSLTRIGVARNFAAFPLPAAMNRKHRLELEDIMAQACAELAQAEMPGGVPFGGRYYSLTPGRHDFMREQDYLGLVKQGVMFKDMNTDPMLMTAGISSEWPHGRGTYISKCRRIFLWTNEQDHMRVFVHFPTAASLSEPLALLQATLTALERIMGEGMLKRSKEFGYITSNPELVGTGMRVSVIAKLPQLLAKSGGELDQVLELAQGTDVLIRPGNVLTPGPLFNRAPPPTTGVGALSSTMMLTTTMGRQPAPWEGATGPMPTSSTPPPGAERTSLSNAPGQAPPGKQRKALTTSLLPQSQSLQGTMRSTMRMTPDPTASPYVEFTTVGTFGLTEAQLLQKLYEAMRPVTQEEAKLQGVLDEAERKVLEERKAAAEKLKAEHEAARRKAAAAIRAAELGKPLLGDEDNTKEDGNGAGAAAEAAAAGAGAGAAATAAVEEAGAGAGAEADDVVEVGGEAPAAVQVGEVEEQGGAEVTGEQAAGEQAAEVAAGEEVQEVGAELSMDDAEGDMEVMGDEERSTPAAAAGQEAAGDGGDDGGGKSGGGDVPRVASAAAVSAEPSAAASVAAAPAAEASGGGGAAAQGEQGGEVVTERPSARVGKLPPLVAVPPSSLAPEIAAQ